MKNISNPTLFDFVLTILLILFSTILAYFLYLNNFVSSENTFVEVYNEGKLLYRDKISNEQLLKFQNFVVEIKNNKVRMKESDCPYKICVNTGWISKPYQQIVCVPNKVYIKIYTDKKTAIDSVTY